MYRKFFKRIIDFVLSLAALLTLSPVFVVLIIVGAVKMKGNPFFLQPRPGKKGKDGKEKIFKLIKFRTMSNAKDANGNLLPDDQRLGKYGAFLRSTSLDELPELFNILLGHMAIVGPRPQLVRDMVFMTDEQRRRHDVRPGLTGLAQVNGRNNITWEQKIEYDLQYIDSKITFVGDVKIIFKTVGKVLKRSDTVREGTVSDMDLGDWLLKEGKVDQELYDAKQAEAKDLLRVKQMKIDGWKYYNHAAIPTVPPHEEPDVTPIEDGSIWNLDGPPLFARWTTDFDCGYETNWWYVICEAPFDMENVSSKEKKSVRQALRKSYAKKIDPSEYVDELYECLTAAFQKYENADNFQTKESFANSMKNCPLDVWGGFDIETDKLIAYMTVAVYDDYVEFCTAKIHPNYFKSQASDTVYYTLLNFYLNECQKKYVCSGTRNINHKTGTQEYKVRRFGYRQAYCNLHIKYSPKMKVIVKVLYPFRKILNKMDKITKIHQINAVLLMESLVRENKCKN